MYTINHQGVVYTVRPVKYLHWPHHKEQTKYEVYKDDLLVTTAYSKATIKERLTQILQTV